MPMHIEPEQPKDFVATWLVKAKADATLNQDMIGLLADHHAEGTSTDDQILKSLLKLTAKPEGSNDLR